MARVPALLLFLRGGGDGHVVWAEDNSHGRLLLIFGSCAKRGGHEWREMEMEMEMMSTVSVGDRPVSDVAR